MARRPPNDGAGWSASELNTLKALAKAGTPTGQVAKKLGRTAAAGSAEGNAFGNLVPGGEALRGPQKEVTATGVLDPVPPQANVWHELRS